jgi:predicted nucleic acid-binding protein
MRFRQSSASSGRTFTSLQGRTSCRWSRTLGAGERAAIAVARRSDLVLVDDALARRHAKLLGLTITGTLGVLLRAKQAGVVPAVSPVIEQLERLGFRLAPETRTAVVKLAGE